MVKIQVALHRIDLSLSSWIDQLQARAAALDVVGQARPNAPTLGEPTRESKLEAPEVEADVVAMPRHGDDLPRARKAVGLEVPALEVEAVLHGDGQCQRTDLRDQTGLHDPRSRDRGVTS